MVRSKRPYIPKVRGCYECSQRRVHCDRRQPDCTKCEQKGIQCSGLGVRYRFRDDTHKKYSQNNGEYNYKFRPCGNAKASVSGISGNCASESVQREFTSVDDGDDTAQSGASDLGLMLDHDFSEVRLRAPHAVEAVDVLHGLISSPRSVQDSVEGWQSFLFVHYSERIASEMVTIDDHNNGWRYLVLQVAKRDELLRDAVLSASAFHFSVNIGQTQFRSAAIYHNAIRRLRQRQDLQEEDLEGQQTVLMSLLLLLTTTMVNGNSDFRTIWRLVETALITFGGEEALIRGELGLFLIRQIRKYRGYVVPYLDQTEAIGRLGLTANVEPASTDGWECFRSYYESYPNLQNTLTTLYNLQKLACNIYMLRAQAGSGSTTLVEHVDKYKTTLESLPPGSPGEHTLVFPTFMAAAEATLPEHQQFFEEIMLRHHKRNGFGNLPLALDHLKMIWLRSDGQDWTKLLPSIQGFIV